MLSEGRVGSPTLIGVRQCAIKVFIAQTHERGHSIPSRAHATVGSVPSLIHRKMSRKTISHRVCRRFACAVKILSLYLLSSVVTNELL